MNRRMLRGRSSLEAGAALPSAQPQRTLCASMASSSRQIDRHDEPKNFYPAASSKSAVSGSATDVPRFLSGLAPKYQSYAISFMVIATYWASHQRIFQYVVR